MNLPYRFALNTGSNPYGRLFDYTTASVKNLTLESIAGAAGLGGSAGTRLAAAGVTPPAATKKFWITGFSVTAYYATDLAVRVAIGLYDTDNAVFIPLYATNATAVNGGGIQKTFGTTETGLYVPQSATLLPAVAVFQQSGSDGAVALAGDVSILTQPGN